MWCQDGDLNLRDSYGYLRASDVYRTNLLHCQTQARLMFG
jgi:hypothetical protein